MTSTRRNSASCYGPNLSPTPTVNRRLSLTPTTTLVGTPLLGRRISVGGDLETEFLHAVDFGDVSLVKRLLEQNPNLDVNCQDDLWRTPLRLAVKNENKELVEILLDLSSANNIHESLLQAIDAGFTAIAETTLKHPRYIDMVKRQRRMGDTDGFFKPERGSQFPSYVTALNLAAQKEQFVIVKHLLQRGDTIPKPHKFACSCQECDNKNKFDQLRMAKCRLDAYRGLASEAYISLNCPDPILTAIDLAEELRKQANNELCFKLEYNDLADQLSCYMVKLLDRVWTHQELDIVLDKTGSPSEDRYEGLARLHMAMDNDQMSFVSHPICQHRVIQRWYEGTEVIADAPWHKKVLLILRCVFLFPFAVIVYLLRPNSELINYLRLPTTKFTCHTSSFLIFLGLIIYSSTETTGYISHFNALSVAYPSIYERYVLFRNVTGRYACGYDFHIRKSEPTVTEFMISVWVVGLIAQECQELWSSGVKKFVNSYYNLMDFLLLSVYTATFTLRYWVMHKVLGAIDFFENVEDVTKNTTLTEYHVYWLNDDRRFWLMRDPINMVEGLFAMANILSFTRISYLLPANESLGPLQITLGRMVNDVLKFMSLAVLVIVAFLVALRNLFWYYAKRGGIELDPDKIKEPSVVKYFGSDLDSFRTVFWEIYGRGGGIKALKLGGYNNTLTEDIGQTIDSIYHITMIILLLNIFIAMMSRSYEKIVECADMEWKFARSALYMNYISEGKLLPVPLNILEIVHCAVFECIDYCKDMNFNPVHRVRKSMIGRRRRGMAATKSSGIRILRGLNRSTELDTMARMSISHGLGQTVPQSRNAATKYEEVMQRIVHRYIMDVQRQNEVGGNADEVKSSMDTMRCDVFSKWRQKDENLAIATNALDRVAQDLSNITEGVDSCELANMCAVLEWWDGMKDSEMENSVFGSETDDNTEVNPRHTRTRSSISSSICFAERTPILTVHEEAGHEPSDGDSDMKPKDQETTFGVECREESEDEAETKRSEFLKIPMILERDKSENVEENGEKNRGEEDGVSDRSRPSSSEVKSSKDSKE